MSRDTYRIVVNLGQWRDVPVCKVAGRQSVDTVG
jgi:hypothetical protein